MKWSPIVLLVFLILTNQACKQIDEFQDAEIISGDAEFAIPLFRSTATIQGLLDNFDQYTFIEISPDNVIHLRYKGDVLSHQAVEYFLEVRSQFPPIIPIPSRLYALPITIPDQLEVDFATYSDGTIGMALVSDYVGMVDLTLTILQAKKDGQPLTVHTQFQSPIGTQPIFFYYPPEVAQVKGYNLEPENGQIWVRYDAVTENGDTIDLPFIALINKDINFSYIEGFLGKFKHRGKRDSITIEFFENWIQGDVFFEKPVIQIHIENSFGVPTRSAIDIFDILTADGKRIPLESVYITDTGIDFDYPANNEVGQTKNMTFTFNAQNSNIEDLLGSKPIALDYKVDAIMNPDNLVGERGFITDSSYYRIQVEVDLPLHGRANGFGIQRTFDVNFDNFPDVKEAEFKLVADNTMPLGIDAQLFFLDEYGFVLDSLFSGITRIVAAAPVNGEGIVTGKKSQVNYAIFTTERFEKVRAAKTLHLEASFSTSNDGQQSVRAFADQNAEIRMGMKLKTN